jgi:hypothetical protein
VSKAVRLSEKWFHRALWLIAFAFAGFLIGLGGLVVGDMPRADPALTLEDYIDQSRANVLRTGIDASQAATKQANTELEQAQLSLQAAQSRAENARDTFNNWVATRRSTGDATQDEELIRRTRELDNLKSLERKAQETVEGINQTLLNTQHNLTRQRQDLQVLETEAQTKLDSALRAQELRVFLLRLGLTLPLLLIAAWLFVKKRKSTYWPFVWGFILFALFTFFVELVPYLPSYGGYVHYIVGIILTAVAGVYAIRALQRYLVQQKAVEALPDQERRKELSYEQAQARMAKSVCPGCERPIDLKDASRNFCMHCGMGLFDACKSCNTRKQAFARYCHGCGTDVSAAIEAAIGVKQS